jgi:hypothetical protein
MATLSHPAAYWHVGLIVLAISAAIVLRFYVAAVGVKYIPVTADEAITMLQAKRVLMGEWPLLVMAQPYEFPTEAYVASILARFAPGNILRTRCLEFAAGFLSLAFLMLVLRSLRLPGHDWLASLLLLFPSAYVLMTQFGYGIPHYNLPPLLCWIAILIVLKTANQISPCTTAAKLMAGVLGGLAFSENMLMSAILIPAFMVLCLQPKWRLALVNIALIALGAAIGLIPLFLALWIFPGAHTAIIGMQSLVNAISLLRMQPFVYTLPCVLGIAPTVYPDIRTTLDFGAELRLAMTLIFMGVLLTCTIIRILEIGNQVRRTLRWPGLTGIDMFVGMAWLALVLFYLNKRSGISDFRYLLPVAWSFPFLIAEIHTHTHGWVRRMIGGGIVILAVFNVLTIIMLTERWKSPDYAADKVGAPALEPVIEFMKTQGIRHCVSSHWQAYRIDYLTDETILCSQPYNERFPEWPLPYKQEVDMSSNVAYVLSKQNTRLFTPEFFEQHLKAMEMAARKSVQGEFSVYYDFTCPDFVKHVARIPAASLTAFTSHNARNARFIVDGSRQQYWTTERHQEKGMWVQVVWTNTVPVSRLVFVYVRNNRNSYDYAVRMNILAQTGEEWRLIGEGIRGEPDPFEIKNRHPVYGTYLRSIGFDSPVMTNAMRIEITEANRRLWWTLAEIEVYYDI